MDPKSPPVILSWPQRILVWLRLVDKHDGMLSLTNVALMLGLFKLATLQTFTLTELSAFLGCLGLYQLKQARRAKRPMPTPDVSPGIAKAQADAASALAQVAIARDDLRTHTDKLKLMLDTVNLGRR